ncbi:TonB-dependent receptor [Duganella sp. CF402]|uniref:TonB-dependent receptor n=1 Tax=unclassified Duganella TaxID=2636909 RepID=UPI0008C58C41|nr:MULTISPECIES: TonB-dependent receptor [unclassified Duganella]RZT08862.1 TonB-dependent receptor [Duganella sp. BK701]SEL79051.1 TonB-dependent receptor [Duganella sp. CF402]
MKHKKMSWLIATLFTSPLLVQDVLAQEAAADGIQQVNVTGIRASVRNALAAKEASNSIVEVIASEDIGKLPDTTIAESLARLPGLSSGLDRGNASQIVARGMGPRFIGATLNGRELASSEPNRAVRFEQFPSESLSGATVYKTQQADLAEGGIATTIDLQTVSPLKMSGRQVVLRADALYYPLGKDIQGADKSAPRVGGVFLDQFANKTIGAALAFSYQDQPAIQKNKRHWGFNETNSVDVTGDGKIDKLPWGFQDEARQGKDKRGSVLGKVEWKPNNDVQITADTYYAEAKIKERGLQHWIDGVGNWDGYNSANYSKLDVRNGYVVGGTISNATLINNDFIYVQDTSVAATGLNGKFNAGEWKIDADLSTSHARRGSAWRDLRQSAFNVPVTWSFPGDEVQNYSVGIDSGKVSNFGDPSLYIDTDGHVRDKLNAAALSASRAIDGSFINRLKVGVRTTDREKSYHQTTWTLAGKTIPASAYETINVDGYPAFIGLKDWDSTIASTYGANAFNPNGQKQEDWQIQNDKLAGWKVKERSTSAFVQGDLDGEAFGKTYRGNVGVRLVHTKQTGYGAESINGAAATPTEAGTSYTEVLPSLNLVFNLDEAQERQVRFSVARAMSRAPLDEMRASRNLSLSTTDTSQPITGSAGNPDLKPMMANQVDLSYQWYFGKGALLSAGGFYKKVSRYIAIESDTTTINGRTATITRSVNGEGGDIRGLELIYQQAFTSLPAPFDGLGIASNYAYTTSNIKEQTPANNPYPIEGLMKSNGGVTLWYEKAGYEARLSANYHSKFARNPTWGAGQLIMNEAETYVTLNLAKQLTPNLQVRFGIDNLTNQKAVYTSANIPGQQEVTEFGRRFNLGLTFKL